MDSILTFDTFFKSVIWGGDRIAAFKGLPSKGSDIGESWELSPMPGHESVVDNGPYKGLTLVEMIDKYGDAIMGHRLMERFGGKFPLLVKFIDSNDDLSIQVHPDDTLAAERHNSLGKTEMWYSVAPTDNAYLYAGFSREVTPEEYKAAVADNTIMDMLKRYDTRKGDVFFLPAGRVHSIGRGNFVLEIQEASDVTYRIYDYGRLGADGKPRELHVEQASAAIDFADFAGDSLSKPVQAGPATEALIHCPYFNTDLLTVDGDLRLNLEERDSFTILISIEGDLTVRGDNDDVVALTQGRTILVPASLKALTIEGKGKVVSVFIP